MSENIFFYNKLLELLNKINKFENQWNCSINLKPEKVCIEFICSYVSITGLKKEVSVNLSSTTDDEFNYNLTKIFEIFRKSMILDFERIDK